ncbi:MAG TPA: HDIG domain-containing protein [Gemmatimonadales bacterium]|nr:HDIG domain-containing protein [Gemmatimonadales bacterium]
MPGAHGTHLADPPPDRSFAARVWFHASRWGWLLLAAVAVYLAFPGPTTREAPRLGVGEAADHDVLSPIAFTVPKDPEEYTREGDALARGVLPVFEYDGAAYDSATTSLQLFFDALGGDRPTPERVWAIAQGFRVDLGDDEAAWLADPRHRRALQGRLTDLFRASLAAGVADAGVVRGEPSVRLLLRRGEGQRVVLRDSVRTFADLMDEADQTSRGWGDPASQRVFRRLVGVFFQPTIVYDHAATQARREQVRRSVDSVKYAVRAGERIVGAHELVTPETALKLDALDQALRRENAGRLAARSVAGAILYDAIILSPFWLLLVLWRRRTYDEGRHVAFFAILVAAVAFLAAGVGELFPARPELLPIPLAAMLVTMLFDGRLAVMAALTLAVLLGSQWGLRDTGALFFGLLGGVAGAVGTRVLRRRHVLYTAVGALIAAYALGAATMGLVFGWSADDFAASVLAGLITALGSAALAMLALPLAESFTGITTQLTLLELSDFRRPLLRRLALEAPGTWAHSISMANLCEAACNAIGANGLLARVGCYYHDVGKLGQPQYFVENQRPGANPHDLLPPAESARIIRRHVLEGVALAEEAKLPPAVVAFIPEHHGTTEIRYFLHRARGPGVTVDPADFRYPGPRPQSAETAVAMLADATEAAVRVLPEPTPEAVREAIEQLVAQRIAGGQLDDAPLTLRELERVKREFARVLAGIHHNRIEYPRASGAVTASVDQIRRA